MALSLIISSLIILLIATDRTYKVDLSTFIQIFTTILEVVFALPFLLTFSNIGDKYFWKDDLPLGLVAFICYGIPAIFYYRIRTHYSWYNLDIKTPNLIDILLFLSIPIICLILAKTIQHYSSLLFKKKFPIWRFFIIIVTILFYCSHLFIPYLEFVYI